MVSSQYPPVYGGAGQQAQLLSNVLVSRGWKVTVVTLDQEGIGSTVHGGLRVVRVLRGIAGAGKTSRALTTVVLGLTAAWLVLSSRPSAVHIHGAYWWSLPPVIAGRVASATSVVKITRDGEDDPGTVFGRKVFGAVPLGWLYGLSLKLCDFVVVLSAEAYNKSTGLVASDRLRLIRNGVDLTALARTPDRREAARKALDVKAGARVTTFVGYLVEHKGVLDLLAAWKLRELSNNSELWLVGPYEGFYRELTSNAIDEIRRMQDAGYKIRLFGQVGKDEMPEIYWASDVFTLPSYKEGMPNSLAEAIAAGCTIVGTAIPGITDIASFASSILVKPGDIAALAEALDSAEASADVEMPETSSMGIDATASKIEELYAKKI
ncbi:MULTISPECIES: glycosyltransferase family 4 protein [Arthrobacter]|nr:MULTISPECIES: glycosyltransferase family 4 protein [Arthrobacter]